MLDNESKIVPIPSSFNPEGIEYLIEEIEAGGAEATSVDPNTFKLVGYKGETISVVIINAFASVEIDKTVSKLEVFAGDEVNYGLTVTNTGALTLDPVVVDDRIPAAMT